MCKTFHKPIDIAQGKTYDRNALYEFDFSYAADQQIKIADINGAEAQQRLNLETAENYRGDMEKIWGTKDIDIFAQVDPVVKIPVLLPVYYITEGSFLFRSALFFDLVCNPCAGCDHILYGVWNGVGLGEQVQTVQSPEPSLKHALGCRKRFC